MNNLLPAVQSAYRKQHSTETAVLKVLSDIYSAADASQITLLGLLDLSSAFDTVDHQILFDRLQFSYGFEGAVLGWFRSYLTGRSQYIRYNGVQSESASVLYGVPQGSVLGPVLFILYSADVIDIATKHGFFCSFLRRRSSDLWSFFADNLLKFGAKDVCLHRRNQHMDGQQPSKTQSIKNWGNMIGFITTAEALPNGCSKYCRCFDQALQICSRSRGVRRRWSVAGGSHLSTLPHVLLSPSSATCRASESHHGLGSLAHQSTCSQSGRLLQRSAGWPTTDSDQQASIHSPCRSSPCAAATRLGQCLESDACAAPLAFHSTEDSVQAVLGGVQVSSQHGADILTRSLRAYLVFWGSFTPPIGHSWRPSHSIDKDCDNRQAWIFCCRSYGLEQFIHYSERL